MIQRVGAETTPERLREAERALRRASRTETLFPLRSLDPSLCLRALGGMMARNERRDNLLYRVLGAALLGGFVLILLAASLLLAIEVCIVGAMLAAGVLSYCLPSRSLSRVAVGALEGVAEPEELPALLELIAVTEQVSLNEPVRDAARAALVRLLGALPRGALLDPVSHQRLLDLANRAARTYAGDTLKASEGIVFLSAALLTLGSIGGRDDATARLAGFVLDVSGDARLTAAAEACLRELKALAPS